MSESFINYLIGSVIILVLVLGIVSSIDDSGTSPFTPTPNYQTSSGGTWSRKILKSDITFHTITKDLGELNGVVSRSLFKNVEIDTQIDTGTFTHVSLQLEVHSANPLGSIVFSSNDEFYRKIPSYGVQNFELDPSTLGSVWTASAAPPALYFWSATEYNFTAKLKAHNRVEGYFQFYSEAFKDYTLFAEVEDSTGGIDIFLNDQMIYSGQEDETIKLELENLHHKNMLRFTPWENSEFEFSLIYLQIEE